MQRSQVILLQPFAVLSFFELFHGKSNLQYRLSALQLVAENGIRQRINPPYFDLNNCASMEYFCTQVEKRSAESFDRQR